MSPKGAVGSLLKFSRDFLAGCGEEIIKRDPSPVVGVGEGAQRDFAV